MLDNNLKISLSLQPLCNELKYLQKNSLKFSLLMISLIKYIWTKVTFNHIIPYGFLGLFIILKLVRSIKLNNLA